MNRAKEIADRTAGRLQGAWDAVREAGYEPLGERREMTRRESATYDRWLGHKDPRNAYERTAFESFPREIDAEMERAGRAATEADAASQREADAIAAGSSRAVIADRGPWEATGEDVQDAEREAGQ